MLKNKRYFIATILSTLVLIIAGFAVKSALDYRSKVAPIKDGITQNTVQQEPELPEMPVTIEEAQTPEVQAADKKPEIIKYVVKPGDTLESISKAYGIKVSTITESNGISKDSLIKDGQELKFPSIDGVLYKVKSGETLWDISSTYDMDVEDIVKANSMDSPDKLKIGQEIIIPGVDKILVAKVESNSNSAGSIKTSSTTKVNSSNTSKSKSNNDNNSKRSGTRLASRGMSSPTSAGSALAGIIWPVNGTITSKFGPRGKEFHKGIDIAAPVGTPIRAAMDGRVTYSGWMNGFGNIVILSHGNGLETYYAHNSKNIVSVGQVIKKGMKIAEVGSTGRSTGPHVDFRIIKNGTAVNPLLYLK